MCDHSFLMQNDILRALRIYYPTWESHERRELRHSHRQGECGQIQSAVCLAGWLVKALYFLRTNYLVLYLVPTY